MQVEAGDGCDAALRGSWGAACQEAAGDPTNATNVANCCELGAEFSACHCDAVLCDDACKGNLQEVAQTCGVMGMGFEPPACTADGCEPLRSAWGAACQEAAGDLTNLTAAVQCCALGAEFSTRACDCDAALCDGACMGNLQRASQSCEMLQMGFELPLCMAARVSGGDSARETTDGTCDAMCSALPNNPCAARCAAGECLYWCAPACCCSFASPGLMGAEALTGALRWQVRRRRVLHREALHADHGAAHNTRDDGGGGTGDCGGLGAGTRRENAGWDD